MATNGLKQGTVTSSAGGLFLWNTGEDVDSLVRKIQEFCVDSPSFDFAGAKWLLSLQLNKRTYGWLGVCFKNEICSPLPRLFVSVGVESGWRGKENRRGETGSFGRFDVWSWLRCEESLRRRKIFAVNGVFVIACQLQIWEAAPYNVLLPESPQKNPLKYGSNEKRSLKSNEIRSGHMSSFLKSFESNSNQDMESLSFLRSMASKANLDMGERRLEVQSGRCNGMASKVNSDMEERRVEVQSGRSNVIASKVNSDMEERRVEVQPGHSDGIATKANSDMEERRVEVQSGRCNGVELNSHSEEEERKKEDESRLLKHLLSLSDNLKQLFHSGDGCDFTIIIRGKKLQAHSAILQARSKVFSSMMTHDMVEKSTREVTIDDCEPGAVQELLHFLYTGKVENLTEDNMQQVYYTADKYEVADLKSECVQFIKKSLTTRVVCEVIVLASKHSEPDLLARATEYFIENIDEVLETVQWQTFLKEHPTEANELYIKALKKIRT